MKAVFKRILLMLAATSPAMAARVVQVDSLNTNTAANSVLATSTEISYLAGVTANLQTQINNAGSGLTAVMRGVTLTPASYSSGITVEVIPDSDIGAGKQFWIQGISMTFIGTAVGVLSAPPGNCYFQSKTSGKRFAKADMQLIASSGTIDVTFLPNPSGTGTVLNSFGPLKSTPTPGIWEGGSVGEGIGFQCPTAGALTCMGPGSPNCDVLAQVWGVAK